jgi:hypothetical protein
LKQSNDTKLTLGTHHGHGAVGRIQARRWHRPAFGKEASDHPGISFKKLASSTSMLPPEAAITDPAATNASCAYQVGKNGHEQDSRRSFVYVVFP